MTVIQIVLADYAIAMPHLTALCEEFYGHLLTGGDGRFDFGFELIDGDAGPGDAAVRARDFSKTLREGFRVHRNAEDA